jgi:hypothetical protein
LFAIAVMQQGACAGPAAQPLGDGKRSRALCRKFSPLAHQAGARSREKHGEREFRAVRNRYIAWKIVTPFVNPALATPIAPNSRGEIGEERYGVGLKDRSSSLFWPEACGKSR